MRDIHEHLMSRKSKFHCHSFTLTRHYAQSPRGYASFARDKNIFVKNIFFYFFVKNAKKCDFSGFGGGWIFVIFGFFEKIDKNRPTGAPGYSP